MASAEEYAKWIVDNQDKQGTPDFETVAKAYQVAKAQSPVAPVDAGPTMMDRGRALVGGINKGIAGFAGTLVDTAENAVNLPLAAGGYLAHKAGLIDQPPDLIRAPGASRDWGNLMNAGGINTENPRPDDATSRMLNTGGMIAGGAMIPTKAPQVLASTIPQQISQAARTAAQIAAPTVAPAVGGAIAGEAIGPEWTGVGSLTPASARQAYSASKNAIASKVAPVLETFRQAGSTPSVGQAMDNVFLHGLENLASKFPGGAGIMQKFVEAQQRSFGNKARTGVSTEDAGRAIESGITGENGFLARTKATWSQLDADLAAKIPPTSGIKPSATLQVLDEMTRPIQGAEKTSMVMTTPKVAEIRNSINSDLSGKPPERVITLLGEDGKTPLMEIPIGGTAGTEVLPYQALRELRSKVGSMLDNALVTGIPGGELKRLYGALSQDMGAAAVKAGAGKEFARQNNYYSGRMNRIETVLERVLGNGRQPEEIFKTFYPTDPDQANKVRAVMRSLSPPERQVVSEAVVNRLGRAKPGAQDVEGQVFSSETFLTNWNKLSPGAKAQLFPDPPLRENIEKIARAAGHIREGKGIYANPSGTAGSFAAYNVYLSPIASIAAGSLAPVVAAGSAAGTAYVGAKMMTNPKVVEWLAKPINPANPNEATRHLMRLSVIYNDTKDKEMKGELSNFIQSLQQQ